ncbi:MAG TPA: PVC-type heme-binding CxxCH protein [Pirellulales bacterium]|nr:PVC-type heme-binding CxxCH protein [Pirellulales bacterium]
MLRLRIAFRAALLVHAVVLATAITALAQMSPEDELKSLSVPDGLELKLFASEPMITNPAAIDVDTHGRVWVAEIQWYRAAAKQPAADKIKVLEDTDGDGRADRVVVFAEDVFCPMSICVAGDKVYVATSPDLWVYEDKDHDLKADGPPTKLLTGFKGQNHDHGAHSLVLGPDHKWWMSHGDAGFAVTGTDGSQVEYQWGAVLRGELDGAKLETVAKNFRNPYEVCVSSFGESYLSDNDNDGNFSVRICWLLGGGNYGWFGRPPARVPHETPFGEHWHFRGHVPGYVPATLVTGFGSPCGICFYEGDALGPHYKNAALHTDAGPREVRLYRFEKSGAGMRTDSELIVTSKDDKYFRPDDICTAPDGSVYLSDWYDGGVGGHAYNNPDQGRIFLLRPAGKKLSRVGQPGPYSNVPDAIEGLKNPNLATQFLARERLLAAGQEAVPALAALLHDEDPNYRARALWVLDRVGGEARQKVAEQLKSLSGRERALAVRILRRHGEEYRAPLLALADDPEIEVRREVILALTDWRGADIDAALLRFASAYDGTDRYLLEAINIAAGDRRKELAKALADAGRVSLDNVDLVQALDPDAAARFVIQALADKRLEAAARGRLLVRLSTIPSLAAGEAVLSVAADRAEPLATRQDALAALGRNLEGDWKELPERPEFLSAAAQLLTESDLRQPMIALIEKQGLKPCGSMLLVVAHAASVPSDARAKALAAAARLNTAGAATACEALLTAKDEGLRTTAARALVDLQAWAPIKKLILAPDTPPALRQTALERTSDSVGGSLVLLKLIEDGKLPDDVRQAIIARTTRHVDAGIRVLYERFIPEGDRPKRLGAAVKPDEILALTGDGNRGRTIFFKSSAARCQSCHQVNGFGTKVGPDLSQIGKKYERRTLLETILEPSKAIAPEFVVQLVETASGEVHAGLIEQQNDKEVVIKNAQGKSIHVPKEDVVTIEPQRQSMMPELVLQDITAQDAADLLAFLTSLTNATPAQAPAGE